MSNEKLPTEAELAILKVLWDQGPSTVHDVQEHLSEDTGYTTVLKFLQIMYDKGMVDREKDGRAHRYWSLLGKEQTQQSMLGRLADQLFNGSIQELMQRAASREDLSRNDLDELETLLRQLKEQDKN